MSEDAAFIRALVADPDDLTTRLVYADWLDDRGDPRGAFLRREVEWAALSPDDPRHLPAYREVSRLAARLDAVWFASVGLAGRLVRRAAAALAPHLTPTGGADLLREWAAALGDLPPLLDQALAPGAAAARFCVPLDYAAFQLTVGTMTDGPDPWSYLNGAAGVVGLARSNCSTYDAADPPFAEGDLLPDDRDIWLEIGGYSDKHWYFLCCDTRSPEFGFVGEGHDYHPWMSGSGSLGTCDRTFLQFLTETLRGDFSGESTE